MRITFLLPGRADRPVGGYKVVYEYANALARRDHDVAVVHPAYLPLHAPRGNVSALFNSAARYALKSALGWRPDAWFKMDPRVRLIWAPTLNASALPDADVVVATWWQTAELLAGLPNEKGRPYYLIQHLETWGGPEERVVATWQSHLDKIVIARWLAEFAQSLGERCDYIPNGLDFQAFGMDCEPARRQPASVAMLYHAYEWKGSREGLDALRTAKEKLPDLRVEIFGTFPEPTGLAEWMRYHRNPQQQVLRDIYNRSAIFLSPSWSEGWPLPPAEALMCGCALICTDIGGHREYAIDKETALVVPPRNPSSMADAIVRLGTDAELRLRLARTGNAFIQQFTWQRSVDAMEKVLADTSA